VNFTGRAARSEFWYWTLFAILASIAGELIDLALFSSSSTFTPVQTLVNLALFLPGLAVSVRRLHDLDRTGWWLLLIFTVIGMIVLLVWDCMRGTVGPNRFGPDPLRPPRLAKCVEGLSKARHAKVMCLQCAWR
jgi:uncharacterized membrane protein YhaH (DUF805 family)